MLTRRQFGFSLGAGALAFASPPPDAPWNGPAIVHKLFLAHPKPTWPYPALDCKAEAESISARLAGLEDKHPGVVRFTGGDLLLTGSPMEPLIKRTAGADAVLVLDLTTSTGPQFEALDKLDLPLLLFQRPLTSWAFMNFAEYLRKGRKADMLNTGDFAGLVPHMYMLRSIHHLRNSKVLVVRDGKADPAAYEPWTRQFGTQVALPSYAAFKAAYDEVPAEQARQAASEFARGALRVVEPKAADLDKALRFYLAALAVLRRERANALTIDCLGGFKRGELPAYPCVAFSKLNDAGLYGVCEADFQSTMTQLLVTSYSGKPGFVSDPTFDTSRNEVIHAHCVAATCMRGLGGAPSPYSLRTHMEDEKGVSLQVEMPVRETVTVGKFANPNTFLVSTGEVTSNLDDKRGCRTKIVTRVANARKFAEGYTGGLHRVVFYGDHSDAIERMGRLMGFRAVPEG